MPPGSELPADEVDMERALAARIKEILLTVPNVGHVHDEPVYVSTPEEASAKILVDDPVTPKRKLTHYIEIGLPTDEETDAVGGGSDEEATGQYFTYPISFSLGVVSEWKKAGFPYTSSARMAIGIYMRARKLFRKDRSLGFKNHVTHYYLQLVSQDEIINNRGEAVEHRQEWELTVRVEGIY
jgi:hypothetical protein